MSYGLALIASALTGWPSSISDPRPSTVNFLPVSFSSKNANLTALRKTIKCQPYMCCDVFRKLRRVFGADRGQGPGRVVLRRPHLRRHPQVEEDPRMAHFPARSRAASRAVRLVCASGPSRAITQPRDTTQRLTSQHGLDVNHCTGHTSYQRRD